MKRVQALTEVVAAVLLAGVVLIVLTQVVTRYLLRVSISWPEEMARYVLVWLTFVGAAAAAARHEQITVDSLAQLGGPAARWLFRLAAAVGGSVALGVLIWASLPLFGPAGRTVSPATGIELRWVYLALPVGGGLLGFFVLIDLARLLSGRAPGNGRDDG